MPLAHVSGADLHHPFGSAPCCCKDTFGVPRAECGMDLWPSVPHRRIRNERTGALRIYIPQLEKNLRLSCLCQAPLGLVTTLGPTFGPSHGLR